MSLMHKSTIYLSDKEYFKLREVAYKERKSMASIIREKLGFLDDLIETVKVTNFEGNHMLAKVPTTKQEVEVLKKNIPVGLTPNSFCPHMKKYKDCPLH